jgi:hypothetical protein
MPERDFIGKCVDCGLTTPIPLKLKWGGTNYPVADRESPLVEWIVNHHAHAPRAVCNNMDIIYDGVMVGYLIVTRNKKFYNSQREEDLSISAFNIFRNRLR